RADLPDHTDHRPRIRIQQIAVSRSGARSFSARCRFVSAGTVVRDPPQKLHGLLCVVHCLLLRPDSCGLTRPSELYDTVQSGFVKASLPPRHDPSGRTGHALDELPETPSHLLPRQQYALAMAGKNPLKFIVEQSPHGFDLNVPVVPAVVPRSAQTRAVPVP